MATDEHNMLNNVLNMWVPYAECFFTQVNSLAYIYHLDNPNFQKLDLAFRGCNMANINFLYAHGLKFY